MNSNNCSSTARTRATKRGVWGRPLQESPSSHKRSKVQQGVDAPVPELTNCSHFKIMKRSCRSNCSKGPTGRTLPEGFRRRERCMGCPCDPACTYNAPKTPAFLDCPGKINFFTLFSTLLLQIKTGRNLPKNQKHSEGKHIDPLPRRRLLSFPPFNQKFHPTFNVPTCRRNQNTGLRTSSLQVISSTMRSAICIPAATSPYFRRSSLKRHRSC
jgi:hypothetical protein